MDKGKREIGIITIPIVYSGTPLKNLIMIINSCSAKTYVITGNKGRIISGTENERMVVSSRDYSTKKDLLNKILNHIILQLFTSAKIMQHKKNVSAWIFFLDTHVLLLPVIIAKIIKKKIIFMPAASIKKGAEAKKSVLLHLLSYSEMLTNRFADRIVLYSNDLITNWDMDLHVKKIVVASEHFLNFDKFLFITKIQDRGNMIGYIGRFSEEKGVQHFAQSLPAILGDRQNLRVLIGGEGQLKESIVSFLQQEDIAIRVDLPGWISHDELPMYLNQLQLLVIPSYTEGLPNIMLEAMACGTPVLATPVGAIPDVIVDGKTGFIMENNAPECIAENVMRALEHPDLERIAESGRRFVGENFTFERVVKRWKEVLEDI
jgi:glycosyltransferase involved in cell wall biosynthesis